MQRLKQLRLEAGVTQKELAERLGVPAALVSGLESGRRQCKTGILILYADYFNVPTDYLLERTDQRIRK